ncbi:hypothetical protein BH23ACT9_BH23ACT9_31930 [soil metagenome]
MTTTSPFGAPEPPQAPSRPEVVPTWRDLPGEPPYGPVRPPRTAHLGGPAAPVALEQDATITPGQIALAVGGTLLLVAIGIGAALLLLRPDDEVATTSPASIETQEEQSTAPPPAPPPPPAAPPSQGELLPQPPPEQPDPQPELPFEPGTPPGQEPPPAIDPQPPAPDQGEEGSIDLPRLFRLRTLPFGTSEDATTVRQTTRGQETETEQITMLEGPEGEIGVRATRAEDAVERFEALITEDARELSVRGEPAYLIDGARLVWLLRGDTPTLLEVDAPPGVEADAMLTIAQGLELVR